MNSGLNETIFNISVDNEYTITYEYYLGMGIGFGEEGNFLVL